MSDAWNPFRLTAEDRFPTPLALVVLLIFVAGLICALIALSVTMRMWEAFMLLPYG